MELAFESGVLSPFHYIIIGKRACRFPGDPNNGRVTPVKFLYELGDRILIQVSYCNNPSNIIYGYREKIKNIIEFFEEIKKRRQ